MSALSPLDHLNICFTSQIPNKKDEYWHWVMKNKKGPALFANSGALQTKVDEYGRESLEKRGPHNWTPLHVACLSGNANGAAYLLKQNVSTHVEDEFHKTPLDYARKFPDVLRLFQKNFPVPDFKSDDTPFTAQAHTNDFGVVVKRLHFSGNVNDNILQGRSIRNISHNMQQIAADEGFKLTFAKVSYFPRDQLICLKNGQMAASRANDYELVAKARDRSFYRDLYFGRQPSWLSMHNLFQGAMGSSARPQNRERAHLDFQTIYGDAVQLPEFRFFIEGGDVFTLTNKNGQRKVLIGKDQLALIHAQCRLEKLFDDKGVELDPDSIQLTPELIRKTAEEMYAMDLLKLGKNKTSGFIGDEKLGILQNAMLARGNDDPIPSLRALAIEMGLIEPFELSEKDLKMAEPIVRLYLAQRAIVLELLSLSLGVPEKDIHFIPKAAYHLDVFLMPGPRASLFIQDYGLCVDSLTAILKQADTLGLIPNEKKMIIRYLETAKLLDKRLSPLLAEARKELEKAGFTVHPIPANFLDDSWTLNQNPKPKHHVIFINANSGFSEKKGRPYLITTGAQVGPKLGKLLMKEFSKAVRAQQPDLKVYFVGYDPKNPEDFSEAMILWNGDGIDDIDSLQAGVHCLSLELETASHQSS